MRTYLIALLAAALPAAAGAACSDITPEVSFCPEGTMWEGLPHHRAGTDPEATLWETSDLAMVIATLPVVFESGPLEVGQRELAKFIDDMAKAPAASEEIARFAPLGEDVPVYARVTRQPEAGTVEYVSLYAIGPDILMIQTVANAESLTQDHGLRHEQALRSLVETGL
jgi:hypothetical protein